VRLLSKELATAENIKSATTRKDVLQALKRGLERISQHKTACSFKNGIALFSGWSMQHV